MAAWQEAEQLKQNIQLVTKFADAVIDLLWALTKAKCVYQGTHEASLAEAQGVEIFKASGVPWNHLQSLKDSSTAISNRMLALEQSITGIQKISPSAGMKLREITNPAVQRASEIKYLSAETERQVAELARNHANRLQGVRAGASGLASGGARDEAALISSQLRAQAAELQSRNIPSTLMPDTAQSADYLRRVRNLPVNSSQAAKGTFGLATAMRLAAGNVIARASFLWSMIYEFILLPLIAALDAFMVAIGSLANAPILLIPTQQLEEIFRRFVAATPDVT
jgi:hypothetical protein